MKTGITFHVIANAALGAGLSGGDRVFIECARRWAKVGYNVHVYVWEEGYAMCKRNHLDNVKYVIWSANRFKKFGFFASYLVRTIIGCKQALKMRFNDGDNSIVYSASDFWPDSIPAWVMRLNNKNVQWVQAIHHLYENPFMRVGKNLSVNLFGFVSQRFSFALIKGRADLLIVVNPIVKQQLSKIGFDKRKIRINYNGIDHAKIQSFQPSIKKYDCVFLGRLSVSKGIFDLVKIWKNVTAKRPYAILAIIGEGDKKLEQTLRIRIKESNLEKNVDVLGYLDDDQVFGALKSSKVFIFPSHEEGFGIAILEAMACGLPIVAWDLPVYKTIFPEGMIAVPINNINVFAEAVLQLLKNGQLRRDLSLKAMEISGRYDWNEVADRELRIMQESLLARAHS